MNPIEFGQKMRMYRIAQKTNQKQLSEETGLSTNTIHLIEAGKVIPNLASAVAIAKALRVGLDDLIGAKHTSLAGQWAGVFATVKMQNFWSVVTQLNDHYKAPLYQGSKVYLKMQCRRDTTIVKG